MANIHKRVIKDIHDGTKNLKKEFGIYICPEESNFYNVHFLLPGPEDTHYEGGLYHGMIRLNPNHPHGPPNQHFITPNGRFVTEPYPISSGSRGICTTTSSFHPEAWTPVNNLETILKGLISLMCDPYDGGIGGVSSTPEQTKKYAKESLNHIKNDTIVKDLFPELHKSIVDGSYKPIKLGDIVVEEPIPKKKIISDDDCLESKKKASKKPAELSDSEEAPKKLKKKIISDDNYLKTKKKSSIKPILSDSETSEETPKKAKKVSKRSSKVSKKKTKEISSEDESSQEAIKKTRKKAPKKKPVIETSSEGESSEEEEEEAPKASKKASKRSKNKL